MAKRWSFQEYSTIVADTRERTVDFEKGQVQPRELHRKIKNYEKNRFYFFFALCTRHEVFLCGITQWFFSILEYTRATESVAAENNAVEEKNKQINNERKKGMEKSIWNIIQ